ncbi:hypothetical protein QQF64_014232 [Cirrhinus molitorella]|uniref:Uncharacterized protein n=1 Tax=Cirrhinus molitorella TaxID=172907 RepID=A0ABR3LVP9_9TELE
MCTCELKWTIICRRDDLNAQVHVTQTQRRLTPLGSAEPCASPSGPWAWAQLWTFTNLLRTWLNGNHPSEVTGSKQSPNISRLDAFDDVISL